MCSLKVFLVVSAFTITVCNGADKPAQLQILPLQPVQSKPVGKSFFLTCRPEVSDPKLVTQFEWRDPKNRKILSAPHSSASSRANLYTEMQGESLALFITYMTEDMAGHYTCVANYANTEPLRKSVQVNAYVPITWVDAPENQYPKLGENYRIRCEVQANPPPNIDWLLNGETLVSNDRYVIENKGLLIKNARESDDGIYTCRAIVISTGELANKFIKVEVQIPPQIAPMKPVEIIEGEQASVQCAGSGKPPPQYTWIKQSTRDDLSQTDRFSVNKNTGLLILNRVESNDDSEYKCVAQNNAGTKELVVKINVLVKPKIYEYINITNSVNTEAKIYCKATGRPAPRILFRKYGTQDWFVTGAQPQDNRIILEQQVDPHKSETTGILTFTNAERKDDGLYECKASNKGGDDFKNGHVTIEFPPSFESSQKQPPVWSWDNRPGNLSCLAESIPNATIEWRLGELVLDNNNKLFKIEGHGPQSNLIVKPHNDDRLYTKYRCIATNRLGRKEHLIELRRAFVPEHVLQAKVLIMTATTIRFDIVGPPTFEGLPTKAFVVQYRREREFTWDLARNHTWSVEAPYILENLEPQTTYTFRFAAVNDVGVGAWGGDQQQTMPRRSVPNEPRILASPVEGISNSPYADHFELRWNVPADNGDTIDFYQIRFCPVQKVNGEEVEDKELCLEEEIRAYENSMYELNRLVPDTLYKIQLRAHNAIGFSSPAELRVKTARGRDDMIYRHEGPSISSAAIIGIVVAAIILVLIIVDVACCCVNRAGILALLCERARSKPADEEDPKLGRDEKEPLKPEGEKAPVIDGLKHNTSVEFDGRQVYSRTGEIIGKNSAV